MDRKDAIADFDAARTEWEKAFAKVPDDALGYLKPGDDYALGGLQVHVNWVLVHYSRVLDAMIARGFAELPPQDRPGEGDAANKKAREGLTAAERGGSLKEMARLHAAVLAGAGRLRGEDWERKAPVIYGEGQDPYPTSADDILGWLRDHYREHVQQSGELVSSWSEAK
jgi:DinB family protein